MTIESNIPAFPSGCAVVFGGSGGLGQACAKLIAERGSDVLVTYYARPDGANKVVSQITAMGRKASAMRCDLKDHAQVHKVIEEAANKYERVHTVVSAAGLTFETGPLADFPKDSFRDVIETDVIGFFNITQAAVREMRKSGGGSIVALVTLAIDRTLPTDGLSATPKAAVMRMIKHIAAEEAVNNIRANAVGPGAINGGMVLPMLQTESKALIDAIVEMTPMKRMGTCEEIAEAVAFFASSKASFITGQSLMVDGGISL